MAETTFIGNLRGSPIWLGDFGSRDWLLATPAKLDPAQFTDALAVPVTVTASAIATATSITVAALTPNSTYANTVLIAQGNVLIPAGTTIYFGGQKVATLTADAHIGDTTLTVAALPTALAGNETGTYSPINNTLYVPSGTIISRTWAQRDALTPYRPGVSTDNELFIMAFDVKNARRNADCELVRPGAQIKENYLPGYGTGLALGTSASPTALLTAIRAKYTCYTGVQ